MAKKKIYEVQDEETRPRAYGLSYQDLKEVKHAQVHNEVIMVPCNGDPTMEIPAHEADSVYMVRTEALFFDENTGEKLSKPRIEKYNLPNWKLMNRVNAFGGKKLEVLHDPTLIEKPKKAGRKPKEQAPPEE